MGKETLIISKGTVRAIHSPTVAAVLGQLGPLQVNRASHVEPTNELSQVAMAWLFHRSQEYIHRVSGYGGPTLPNELESETFAPNPHAPLAWWADMHPCGVACVLGPFATREEALAKEVEWLKANNIPVRS